MASATKNTNSDSTKEVKAIKEENVSNINIDEIISKAVEEAIKKTTEQYSGVINELNGKVNSLNEENKSLKDNIQDKPESLPKRVKIMYMGSGRASFPVGKVNIEFKNLFDVRDMLYDTFEDMLSLYSDYFNEFELVILSQPVREHIGIEYAFEDHGANKDIFYDMLKMSIDDCMIKIGNLSFSVANAFLKFFIEEHLKGNVDAMTKFSSITDYYMNHFGYDQIQEQIAEMKH